MFVLVSVSVCLFQHFFNFWFRNMCSPAVEKSCLVCISPWVILVVIIRYIILLYFIILYYISYTRLYYIILFIILYYIISLILIIIFSWICGLAWPGQQPDQTKLSRRSQLDNATPMSEVEFLLWYTAQCPHYCRGFAAMRNGKLKWNQISNYFSFRMRSYSYHLSFGPPWLSLILIIYHRVSTCPMFNISIRRAGHHGCRAQIQSCHCCHFKKM